MCAFSPTVLIFNNNTSNSGCSAEFKRRYCLRENIFVQTSKNRIIENRKKQIIGKASKQWKRLIVRAEASQSKNNIDKGKYHRHLIPPSLPTARTLQTLKSVVQNRSRTQTRENVEMTQLKTLDFHYRPNLGLTLKYNMFSFNATSYKTEHQAPTNFIFLLQILSFVYFYNSVLLQQ